MNRYARILKERKIEWPTVYVERVTVPPRLILLLHVCGPMVAEDARERPDSTRGRSLKSSTSK